MINPFLDNDGFDSISQTYHCIKCEVPIFNLHSVLKDHILCSWTHYGFILFPEILAQDSQGKTLEGVILQPSRNILANIPEQTGLSWCLDCRTIWSKNGCGVCGEVINEQMPYSMVNTLEKLTNNTNQNFYIYKFHYDCLPREFSIVRIYHQKYSP